MSLTVELLLPPLQVQSGYVLEKVEVVDVNKWFLHFKCVWYRLPMTSQWSHGYSAHVHTYLQSFELSLGHCVCGWVLDAWVTVSQMLVTSETSFSVLYKALY